MTTETHSTTDHGMSNAGYVRIAAILAAITALEVATYYVDLGALFLPSLLIMMAVKFYIVVSFFMHLRYESKTVLVGLLHRFVFGDRCVWNFSRNLPLFLLI